MRKIWDGHKLKVKQAMADLSNRDLAEKLDLNEQFISDWRRGIEPPSIVVNKLVRVFSCKAEDFFVEVPE